jgi:glycosyltransferase involved in cell wall biosynthesis
MSDHLLSVIICAHNPRRDFLESALESLQRQMLDRCEWELVVVDNASSSRVSDLFDLSWHPNARHVIEPKLGLSNARFCGIRETIAPLIVFVDDDCILDPAYLSRALDIAKQHSSLGTWGGQCLPRLESPMPEWFVPYEFLLTVRRLTRDQWSNLGLEADTIPFGAGLCVRRDVAEAYAAGAGSSFSGKLGRTGGSLVGGDDVDICMTALKLGYGTGLFAKLTLIHQVAAKRCEDGYLLRLLEGTEYSDTIIRHLYHAPSRTAQGKLETLRRWWNQLRMPAATRKAWRAQRRGQQRANSEIAAGQWSRSVEHHCISLALAPSRERGPQNLKSMPNQSDHNNTTGTVAPAVPCPYSSSRARRDLRVVIYQIWKLIPLEELEIRRSLELHHRANIYRAPEAQDWHGVAATLQLHCEGREEPWIEESLAVWRNDANRVLTNV